MDAGVHVHRRTSATVLYYRVIARNVSGEAAATYLVTRPKLAVRADVVEFIQP